MSGYPVHMTKIECELIAKELNQEELNQASCLRENAWLIARKRDH
jgi:hypothetical protein